MYLNLNSPDSGHHMIIPDSTGKEVEAEIQDYYPRFSLSTPKLAKGFLDTAKHIDRDLLPTGRPLKEPNLVETREANGFSIDEEKVFKSFNSLAHVPNQHSALNFSRQKARDLSFYMSNDRVRNILHDNDTLMRQEMINSDSADKLTVCSPTN